MCHPFEVRALTVGECARIQEFPDGWTFVGTATQQMKQVGNAVPTRLGRVAGEVIQAHARYCTGGCHGPTSIPPGVFALPRPHQTVVEGR